MRKVVGLGLLIIMVSFFLLSCGVPQETLNKANSDLAATQAQIQSLQDDLAKTRLSMSDMGKELTATKSELASTKFLVRLAKRKIEVVNALFAPALNGTADTMTLTQSLNYFLGLRDKIRAIGDPIMDAKFQSMTDSILSGENPDTALLSFLKYLFESMGKTLE